MVTVDSDSADSSVAEYPTLSNVRSIVAGAGATIATLSTQDITLNTRPTSATPAVSGTTTAAGAACTDAACCTAIDKSPRSCTDCLANAGCEYHATAKNNVIDLGGKCLLKGSPSPVETKKVDMASQCLDTCSGFSCSDCIGKTDCVFCDSAAALDEKVGAKTGISSGTCEKSCKIAASERKTCSVADTCSGYSCSECIGKAGCVFCDSLAEAGANTSGSGTCEKSCKTAASERKTCNDSGAASLVVSAVAMVASIALAF